MVCLTAEKRDTVSLHFGLFEGGDWNRLLLSLPQNHILQTEQWADFKRITGWTGQRYRVRDDSGQIQGGVQVLRRRVGPLQVLYAPKGPLLDPTNLPAWEVILGGLEKIAQRALAVQIKIDPEVVSGWGVPGTPEARENPQGQAVINLLKKRRWRFSPEQVQFRNTIVIDLSQSEDALLAAMGQGKRRKVRYGARHGVTVRPGTLEDLPLLYQLYAETGKRNQFITRPYDYYLQEWGLLMKAGMAHALIAEVGGRAVAHVILFKFGPTCLYFTGASISDNEVRKLMPADLLQWEAMRWAKAQGCTTYDLWGAPNDFHEGDSMWGVYQFKRDLGGVVTRHIGAWDYAPYPPLYTLYTRIMPRLLAMMRRRRQPEPNKGNQDQDESDTAAISG